MIKLMLFYKLKNFSYKYNNLLKFLNKVVGRSDVAWHAEVNKSNRQVFAMILSSINSK